MGKLLWEPSKERILNANISKFIDYVNNKKLNYKFRLEVDN